MTTAFDIVVVLLLLMLCRQASSIKPLHFEILTMIGEVAGYANDLDSMHNALSKASDILDGLNMNHRVKVPTITLASMYHKVANAYITVSITCLVVEVFIISIIFIIYLHSFMQYIYIYINIYVTHSNRLRVLSQ